MPPSRGFTPNPTPPSPVPDPPEDQLPGLWLAAIATPAIATHLEAIYAMISDQIQARGPACWASGRCCNFIKTGHRLYTTGLEVAFALTHLPPTPPTSPTPPTAPQLTAETLAAAVQRGDCPFLVSNICGIHTSKPSACRIYFCDRSAATWQETLSEHSQSMLRSLHTTHNIPYRYGEWRGLLASFLPHL